MVSNRAEFDENVKASKDKASAALQRVPEIQALIEEAENKTRDARGALKDAEADANAASDIAKEAQRIAEQASKVNSTAILSSLATALVSEYSRHACCIHCMLYHVRTHVARTWYDKVQCESTVRMDAAAHV